MQIQEEFRRENDLVQKKNTICHITVVALNIQKNIKAETEKYKVTLEVAQKKCTLPSNLEKPEGNDSYEIEKY